MMENNLPKNVNLPLFAYGIFRKDHWAFERVSDFVESVTEDFINAEMWSKDGLLIAQIVEETGQELNKIEGHILHKLIIMSSYIL